MAARPDATRPSGTRSASMSRSASAVVAVNARSAACAAASSDAGAGALAGVQDVFFRYAGDPGASDRGELFDVETWTFTQPDDPTEPAEPQPTTVTAGGSIPCSVDSHA